MKIFMATMGLDIGGAETHIVELSKELQARGHEVVIASNGGVYVPEVTAAGIRHYHVPMHRRSFRDMMRSRALLKDILRKEKPDIVHAHARIPAFLCGTLQHGLKFPFVTSCHGVYQVKGALKLLSNWGDRTLAVSEDIRDYLIREYGVPAEHITLTINGIDTNKFSPNVSGQAIREEFGLGDGVVVGHVSRLDQAACHTARQLIELAPRLEKACPGLHILITGGGDSFAQLKERAEQVNRGLGRSCVVLTGPRTDVNAVAAASQVFVGVSRAALEAMAEEKPVILSGAQGHTGLFCPELLQKAIDTNFCCRTDPVAQEDTLYQAVVQALALPREEQARLGAYGRQTVQTYYSVQRMTQDCVDVYEQVRRRKYRVVMSGYYGFSNAGDDAILQSIHEGILAASKDISVTVLSNDPQLTWDLCSLEAVPRFRFWKVMNALRHCDALLSGGGSLLQDRTSTRSLLYYLSIIRGAELFGKPVMLYANGIGPVRKAENRRRVKRAVERAALVTLRDRSSANELREMGVKRPDLYVTADPVFNLPPAAKERGEELLRSAQLPEDKPFVTISVRNWPGTGEFPRQLAALCDHLRRSYGMEILFLLMQPGHDRDMTRQVRQAMEEPSYLLDADCTPRELMAVLGRAKLCVAMRLHTLIFAARMAVPCMGLVYDPKVESYLQELDMPSAGHVECFDLERAVACADDMMEHYEENLIRLREKSQALAQAALRNEELLLELLEHKKG